MSKALSKKLEKFFWDVPLTSLDVEKDAFFIIKRMLDRGGTNDIRWLLKTYSQDQIINVIKETRDLARPTGNFWADFLGINKKDIPCLQKPYFPIHFGLSS